MSMRELNEELVSEIREKPSIFVEEILGIEPFDYQKDVLDSGHDRIAFVSGRQVGKSRTASWLALHHALTHHNSTVLITAPTQRQSSELFTQVKKEMKDSDLSDEVWGTERETRTIIEFANGSRILCLPTGVDGNNIRGYTAGLVIVDEAAFIEEDIFYQVLLPMLAVTDGTLALLSTPKGASGFLNKGFNDELEEEFFKKQVPTYRNPEVSEEYIMNQQKQLDSTTFKQEILGKFVESADSFFPTEIIDRCVENESMPPQAGNRCFLGVDLARHGEDESVYISIDSQGNVFNVESDAESGLHEAIGHIKHLYEQFSFDRIYIDETALGGGVVDVLKNDMRSHTVKGVTFTNDKKQSLYNTLKSKMEAGDIRLPDNSKLRTQLLSMEYEFTTGGKMKINAPETGHDDYCDALALAVWGFEKGGKVRQAKPSSL